MPSTQAWGRSVAAHCHRKAPLQQTGCAYKLSYSGVRRRFLHCRIGNRRWPTCGVQNFRLYTQASDSASSRTASTGPQPSCATALRLAPPGQPLASPRSKCICQLSPSSWSNRTANPPFGCPSCSGCHCPRPIHLPLSSCSIRS